MNNKIRTAFEPIHATDELKQRMTVLARQETTKRQRKTLKPLRYAVACSAMIVLMICGTGGYRFYQTPISYISIDVNPSIELGLNRLDRVVSVDSYNDDGAAILRNLSLKNKPYTEAVELLLADKLFESYLSEDSYLSFAVVSDKEEVLLAGIQNCRGYAENSAQCHSANTDLRNAAHESGLSFGKYQAYLELSQYDKNITPEDCHAFSMHQLRDMISTYEEGSSEIPVPNSKGNRNGNGHHDR